jgi:predicted nucleic acid-binding protein
LRRGLDTNVLVYAHVPAMPGHGEVKRFLEEQLAQASTTLVLTPLVLHELIHVLTDGRRFDPPVCMDEAIAIGRLYLGRANVEVLPVDEDALRLALELIERHRLGRKRIADTLLAATLLAHGVTELVTCNPEDFAVLSDLRVIDPRLR